MMVQLVAVTPEVTPFLAAVVGDGVRAAGRCSIDMAAPRLATLCLSPSLRQQPS